MRQLPLLLLYFLFFVNVSFGLDKVNQRLLDHAIACPATTASNIPKLVTYLKSITNSDKQAVEVFCYWIAEHIAYDTKAYTSGRYPSNETILVLRKGVCSNYAALLQKMCTEANIECHLVDGYSKGYSYIKGSTFTKADHTWNIVKVKGEYSFIDVTWASGNVSKVNGVLTFNKELDIKQIFADSNFFTKKHLPADPRWQLRRNPITIKSFSQHDSVKEMLKNVLAFYSFKDSITTYLKADSVYRSVITAESIYRFNPIASNLQGLATTYHNYAYYHSHQYNDVSHFTLAIQWYEKAISTYQKLNSAFGTKWAAEAQKGITYSNSKIKELTKPPK